MDIGFPSPHGDCISQMDMRSASKSVVRVSVPSRGLHFSNHMLACWMMFSMIVSVPSRGLHFSNSLSDHTPESSKDCFRPLTGTAFLKSVIGRTWSEFDYFMFPSPHGDCISQIGFGYLLRSFPWMVSVPSRGLHFSNDKMFYFEGNMTLFPSPHGDCISQMFDSLFSSYYFLMVSVPLRGLHFSNTIPGTLCFSWGYFAFCVGKIILRNTAFWNHKKPHNLQYFCGARENQEIKISHCPIIYSFPL